MPTAVTNLLLKFRARDTQFGVTRSTVKAMAKHFDLSETEVVHMALSRLAKEEMPGYEADDGPLSAADLKAVSKLAKAQMPEGAVLREQLLF